MQNINRVFAIKKMPLYIFIDLHQLKFTWTYTQGLTPASIIGP